jgi:hypothetical protein
MKRKRHTPAQIVGHPQDRPDDATDHAEDDRLDEELDQDVTPFAPTAIRTPISRVRSVTETRGCY